MHSVLLNLAAEWSRRTAEFDSFDWTASFPFFIAATLLCHIRVNTGDTHHINYGPVLLSVPQSSQWDGQLYSGPPKWNKANINVINYTCNDFECWVDLSGCGAAESHSVLSNIPLSVTAHCELIISFICIFPLLFSTPFCITPSQSAHPVSIPFHLVCECVFGCVCLWVWVRKRET